MPKYQLKPGVCIADVLDGIEASVVKYMMGKRSIDEKAMRDLIHTDEEVRASYLRKNQRSVRAAIASGVDRKLFRF